VHFRPWRESIASRTTLLDWCLARLAALFPEQPHILVCDPVDGALLLRPTTGHDTQIVVSSHIRDIDAFLDVASRTGGSAFIAAYLETALCPPQLTCRLDPSLVSGASGLALFDGLPPRVSPLLLNTHVAQRLRGALSAEEAPGTFQELFAFAAAAGLDRIDGMGCGVAVLTGPNIVSASREMSVAFDSQDDVQIAARVAGSTSGDLSSWIRESDAQASEARAARVQSVRAQRRPAPDPDRLRVLFVSNTSALSGVESCTLELVRALIRLGVEASALVAYEGHWTQALRASHCEVHCANRTFDDDSFAAWNLCTDTLQRSAPDVVHLCGNPGPTVVRAALAAGVPVVQHAHVPTPPTYESMPAWADRFVAVSEAVAGVLTAAGVDPSLIRVVPNGIDPEPYADVQRSRDRARRELGLPQNAFVVLAMARFSREKRLDVVVDAVTRLRHLAPEVHLVLVGESHSAGSTWSEISRQIQASGLEDAVSLPGFMADVRPVLGAADALVMPSEYEGFGMVALEAMASGVPLVSTDVGGLREFLGEPQDTWACGLRVDSHSPAALADALLAVRGRPSAVREMADRGRALVRQRYSVDRMSRAFISIYADVVASVPHTRVE
jgi:glycosyltransferase involved in cell wall biosynthesis